MATCRDYNKLEFSGSMLKPGFSVYLFEIITKRSRFFYVGMTGDGYYPSARSAIHRLSGHFERNTRSTQNQVSFAISKNEEINIEDARITMHHWPIEGFKPWNEPLKGFKPEILDNLQSKKYNKYKQERNKILKLEQYLIWLVKDKHGDNCFNDNSQTIKFDIVYSSIVEDIKKIIK